MSSVAACAQIHPASMKLTSHTVSDSEAQRDCVRANAILPMIARKGLLAMLYRPCPLH